MKRKLMIALSVITAASMTVGCASSKSTYGEYLKLGEYKGLEINKIKTEVTDEDVEYEIESLLEENAEYNEVDRGAEDGDQLNIDFTGTLDGEEFEEGTDSDYDLVLGSGDFDETFEEQLIRAKAGDTLQVTQTFTEDYDEELAGKTAIYDVTVNSVQEVSIPELTDEYCKENTDYASVDEYRTGVRKELEEYYEDSNTYTAGSDALSLVISNSEFSGYPQELYDECKKEYDASNEAMAEMFGMDVSDFASDDETKSAVTEMVYTRMAVTEISEREKITVSDEEYKEHVNSIYEESGYASAEEYEADYNKESTMYEILYDKVIDFLMKNAKVTEVTEDEYYDDSADDYDSDDFDMEEDLDDIGSEDLDEDETETAEE